MSSTAGSRSRRARLRAAARFSPTKTVVRDRGAASSCRPSARRPGASSVTTEPASAAARPTETRTTVRRPRRGGWARRACPPQCDRRQRGESKAAPPTTSGLAANAPSSRRARQRSSALQSVKATPHLLRAPPRADGREKRLSSGAMSTVRRGHNGSAAQQHESSQTCSANASSCVATSTPAPRAQAYEAPRAGRSPPPGRAPRLPRQ